MQIFISILQALCTLIAAAILGTWYISEFKKVKAAGRPWYSAYLTPPGIMIIIIIIVLPIIARLK